MHTNRLHQAIGLMHEDGTCSRNKERVSGISSKRQEKTKQEYRELKSLFHVRSRVEDYLQIW